MPSSSSSSSNQPPPWTPSSDKPSFGTPLVYLATENAITLGRNSNAKTLLTTAISLNLTQGRWASQFLLSLPPEQIGPIIKGDNAELREVLIKKNLMTASEIKEGVFPPSKPGQTSPALPLFHLANPLLSEAHLQSIIKANPENSEVLGSILANPNCPRSLNSPDKPNSKISSYYEVALSIYGDLTNPATMEALEHIMSMDSQASPLSVLFSAQRHTCLSHLISRDDLPAPVVRKLDPILTPPMFETLAKSETHRHLVKDGILTGMNSTINTDNWKLVVSPEVSAEVLVSKFRQTKVDDYDTRRTLASHVNAPPSMVEEVINTHDPEVTTTFAHLLVENQNPHAEPALINIRSKFQNSDYPDNLGSLLVISPSLLETASEEAIESRNWSAVASSMCHPNFPWGKQGKFPLDLLSNMDEEYLMAALAARAASGVVTNDDYENANANLTDATALLFAPNLSSHRLGKLVEKHPGLTPLAAVHPNGFDISTESLEPEVREIVERTRVAPLPGYSSQSPFPPAPTVLSI